ACLMRSVPHPRRQKCDLRGDDQDPGIFIRAIHCFFACIHRINPSGFVNNKRKVCSCFNERLTSPKREG
ncbi:MAG: hypothetical protein R6U40_06970, partial [Desulfobacterales bacterium]